MWRTKDHLRSEIERLRKEVHQSHDLIKALAPTKANNEWNTIHSRLQRGDPPERIADWINSLKTPRSSGPTPSPDSRNRPLESPGVALSAQNDASAVSPTPPSVFLQSSASMRETSSSCPRSLLTSATPASSHASWTHITHDTEVIHRLLYHFFNRCFPDFSFVQQERFMRDFNEGTELYCSPALLNAVLGFASQSRQVIPATGHKPWPSRQFLSEAHRLLKDERTQPEITSIQAIGILALAEVNAGNDEAAFQLSKECARDTILLKMQLDREGDTDVLENAEYREAMALTFCGSFSLIRMFRLLTGRLSTQTGPLFMRLTEASGDAAAETPEARVERGVALQHHFISQLDYCPEPMKLVYTATEIAHTFCTYHHDDGVTASDLIPAYRNCLEAWNRFNHWLPDGSQTSKEALFWQIWYNYILLVLSSTLVDDPIDLRQGITPKSVATQASQTIILLSAVYQDHHGFEFIHPLFPHMVFAATLFQLQRSLAGDGTQQSAEKHKRFSEPHTPTPVHSPSSLAPPPKIGLRRQKSQSLSAVSYVDPLVYPPLEEHIATATLCTLPDLESSLLRSPNPPAKLAEDGTRLLNQMATGHPKAAELTHIMRVRSVAGLASDTVNSPGTKQFLPTSVPCAPPVMDHAMVDYVPPPAGLFGLGIDNIQGFAALTSVPGSGVVPVPSIAVRGASPAEPLDNTGDYGSYFTVGSDIYGQHHQQPAAGRRGSTYSAYSPTRSGTTGAGSASVLDPAGPKMEAYVGDMVGGIY